jgi:hypothetical protein
MKLSSQWNFGRKMQRCPAFFNGFLDMGLLLLKIRLELEDALVATRCCISITLGGTFSTQPRLMEASFNKDSLDSFGFIWELWVVRRKHHILFDLDAIMHEPSISHASLLPCWIDVHARNEQCIFSICGVPL